MSYLANWQSYTSLARLLNGLALVVVALVAQFSPEFSGPGYAVLGLLLAYFVISAAPQLRTRVQANALFLIVDLLLVTFVVTFVIFTSSPFVVAPAGSSSSSRAVPLIVAAAATAAAAGVFPAAAVAAAAVTAVELHCWSSSSSSSSSC